MLIQADEILTMVRVSRTIHIRFVRHEPMHSSFHDYRGTIEAELIQTTKIHRHHS